MKNSILNYLVIAAVLVLAAFSGCKKEEVNSGNNTGTSNLVSKVLLSGGEDGTFEYHYDNQNRITSITFNGNAYMTITYPDANTIRIDVGGDFSFIFTKNNDGYVTKYGYIFNNLGITPLAETFEYENGYLKKYEYESGEYSDYGYFHCVWENANLISDGKNSYSYGTTLFKETNIAPYFNFAYIPFYGQIPIPISWFGKTSKNLMETLTYTEGEDAYISSYTYETNAEGYVTKVFNNGELEYEIKYK